MTSLADAYADAHLDLKSFNKDIDEAEGKLRKAVKKWERIARVTAKVEADTNRATREIRSAARQWKKIAETTAEVTADTTKATREIRAAQARWEREITLPIDADTTKASAEIAAARQRWEANDVTLDVDADTGLAAGDIDGLVVGFSDETVNIRVEPDGIQRTGAEVHALVDTLDRLVVNIKIEPDTHAFLEELVAIEELGELQSVHIEVKANTTPAQVDVQTLIAWIKTQSSEIKVGVDMKGALEEFATKAALMDETSVDITVTADTAPAVAQSKAAAAVIDRESADINVGASTVNADSIFSKFSASFEGFLDRINSREKREIQKRTGFIKRFVQLIGKGLFAPLKGMAKTVEGLGFLTKKYGQGWENVGTAIRKVGERLDYTGEVAQRLNLDDTPLKNLSERLKRLPSLAGKAKDSIGSFFRDLRSNRDTDIPVRFKLDGDGRGIFSKLGDLARKASIGASSVFSKIFGNRTKSELGKVRLPDIVGRAFASLRGLFSRSGRRSGGSFATGFLGIFKRGGFFANLGRRFQRGLSGVLQVVGRVFEGFGSIVGNIGGGIQKFGQVAGQLVGTLASVGSTAAGVVAIIGILSVVLNALVVTVTAVVTALAALIVGVIGLAAGFLTLGAAAGAASAGVIALGIAFNEDFKQAFEQGIGDLKDELVELATPVAEDFFARFFERGLDALSGLAQEVIPLAQHFAFPITEALIGWVEELTRAFDQFPVIFAQGGAGIASVIDTFTGYLTPFADVVSGLTIPGFDAINAVIELLLDVGLALEEPARKFFDFIITAAEKVTPVFIDFNDLLGTMFERLQAVFNNEAVGKFFERLPEVFGKIGLLFEAFGQGFLETFGLFGSSEAEGTNRFMDDLIEHLRQLQPLAAAAGSAFSLLFQSIKVVTEIVQIAAKGIGEFVDFFFEVLNALAESLRALVGLYEKLPGVLQPFDVSGLKTGLDVLDEIAGVDYGDMFSDLLSGSEDMYGATEKNIEQLDEYVAALGLSRDAIRELYDQAGQDNFEEWFEVFQRGEVDIEGFVYAIENGLSATDALNEAMREITLNTGALKGFGDQFETTLGIIEGRLQELRSDDFKFGLEDFISFEESENEDGVVETTYEGVASALNKVFEKADQERKKVNTLALLEAGGLSNLASELAGLDGETFEYVTAELASKSPQLVKQWDNLLGSLNITTQGQLEERKAAMRKFFLAQGATPEEVEAAVAKLDEAWQRGQGDGPGNPEYDAGNTAGTNLVAGFSQAAGAAAPQLTAIGQTIVGTAVGSIGIALVTSLGTLRQSGEAFVAFFALGVSEGLETANTAGKAMSDSLIAGVLTALASKEGVLLLAGQLVSSGVSRGIEGSTSLVSAAADAMVGAAQAGIVGGTFDAAVSVRAAGEALTSYLAAGITSSQQAVGKAGESLVTTAVGRIIGKVLDLSKTMRSTGSSLGSALMSGFNTGLANGATAVYRRAASIAREVAAIIRSSLQVKSPSRVTIQIGEDVARGLAIGLEDTSLVSDAAAKLAQASIPNLSPVPAEQVRSLTSDAALNQQTVQGVAAGGAQQSGGGDVHYHEHNYTITTPIQVDEEIAKKIAKYVERSVT